MQKTILGTQKQSARKLKAITVFKGHLRSKEKIKICQVYKLNKGIKIPAKVPGSFIQKKKR